jgi:transposase
MDRGFYDLKNIKQLLSANISFIVGGRKNVSFISRYIRDSISLGTKTCTYIKQYEIFGRTYEELIPISLKDSNNKLITKLVPIHVHIICDIMKHAKEKIIFNNNLDTAVEAVINNSASEAQKKLVNQYCEITYNKDKTFDINYLEDKISVKTSEMGYFCLVSDVYPEIAEVIKVYRQKDTVEKAFHIMKSALNRKRTTQMHSIVNVEGHTFLKFVALILRLAIHKIMIDKELYGDITMDEMLGDLNLILKYIYPNTAIHFSEILEKQYDWYDDFEIDPPDFIQT